MTVELVYMKDTLGFFLALLKNLCKYFSKARKMTMEDTVNCMLVN